MKQKLIIGISLILLLGVMGLIVADLFKRPSREQENPEMYSIEKLKIIDTSQICFREVKQFKTDMSALQGLALDLNLNVYVCGDQDVQVYNRDWEKTSGFRVDSDAYCIAPGAYGEIYLGLGDHIEVFDLSGARKAKWNAYNDRSFLTSIVVIGDEIFAADAENKVVLRYDRYGSLLNTIGKKDRENGIDGFIIPSMYFDIAVGPDSELWAANTGRHELERFSFDGKLISFWGKASMQLEGFAGCCNPVHFAIMPDGQFVTYEKGLDRIKLYNQAGEYACTVSGPVYTDEKSLATCSVSSPVHDLAVDREGKVYALDGEKLLIRVFISK
jgi:hypothetical protein